MLQRERDAAFVLTLSRGGFQGGRRTSQPPKRVVWVAVSGLTDTPTSPTYYLGTIQYRRQSSQQLISLTPTASGDRRTGPATVGDGNLHRKSKYLILRCTENHLISQIRAIQAYDHCNSADLSPLSSPQIGTFADTEVCLAQSLPMGTQHTKERWSLLPRHTVKVICNPVVPSRQACIYG